MWLQALRLWLPGAVVVGGLVVMVVGGENGLDGGAGIVGAGLAIWLMNVLWRVGVRGDREREREAAARAYYDRHGRWPEDA